MTARPTPALTASARVANLLDRSHATAAQLGPSGFDSGGRFVAQPFAPDGDGRLPLRSSTFHAPGATRPFSISVRYAFD